MLIFVNITHDRFIYYLKKIGRYSRSKAPRKDNLQFKYSRNEYIKSEEVRLIDDEGNNLGIQKTKDAIAIAQERELDLIEVSPVTKPPVAKIMSWSKFKYDLSKKKKESRSKSIDQKEMWFKVFIEEGDLEHKLRRVKEFLEKKHPVKITIKGRGRVNRENFINLMEKILDILGDDVQIDNRPKFEGRNYAVIVKPAK